MATNNPNGKLLISGNKVKKTGKYDFFLASHTQDCHLRPMESERVRTLVKGSTFPYLFLCGHSVQWEKLEP